MEPTNFSWFIDGKIAALGFPSSHADVEFLCKIGVKQLISLTETPPCLYGMKLTQVHIPIDDMTAPSIQQVNEFLRVVELAHLKGERDIWKMDWCRLHMRMNDVNDGCLAIDEGTSEKISEFQAVAVHCRFGLGRVGTMLACYLVKTTNCSAAEAISIVRRKRPGSIETRGQEKLVQEFSLSLG
ncbi:dual specificity protein phosphatase 23-like [Acropora millepora]|uniref:dual specificity protein phosphatase 23-like n=1 Tax=Acropora millepora TaxID=45264 RepID=UPI0010FC9D8E|nr:dual specificity protein phosphatase 23-like [Acropora millepora]